MAVTPSASNTTAYLARVAIMSKLSDSIHLKLTKYHPYKVI